MNSKGGEQEGYRTFQLMSEIEGGEAVSQRELASRLGIAVGLVNSYLKNFVAKGYIRVKNYPRNRYAYLLTPKGFAEKSRLAYQHLNYFNGIFKTARHDYAELFRDLSAEGVQRVAFLGADEVAEIAFLSLRETPIEMAAIFAEDQVGEVFFRQIIRPESEVVTWEEGPVVITTAKDRERLYCRAAELCGASRVHCPGMAGTSKDTLRGTSC